MLDNDFLKQQQKYEQISVKKIYIDMVGDLKAAIILDQIIYWSLPDKKGKSKLRVFKDDDEGWIAKSRREWQKETRLTVKEQKRCIRILTEQELIETKLYRFNSIITLHYRLKEKNFLSAIQKQDEIYESMCTKGIVYQRDSVPKDRTTSPKVPTINRRLQQKTTRDILQPSCLPDRKRKLPKEDNKKKEEISLSLSVAVDDSDKSVKKPRNDLEIVEYHYCAVHEQLFGFKPILDFPKNRKHLKGKFKNFKPEELNQFINIAHEQAKKETKDGKWIRDHFELTTVPSTYQINKWRRLQSEMLETYKDAIL